MEIMYTAKVIKIGNSFGVVVPKAILKAAKLQRGDVIIYGFTLYGEVYFRKITDVEIRKLRDRFSS